MLSDTGNVANVSAVPSESLEQGRHAVIAVDYSDSSHAAMNWAITNFSRPGDTFHFVHCYSPLEQTGRVKPTEDEQMEWQKQENKVLTEFMFAAKLEELPGINFQSHLLLGDPKEKLLEISEQLNVMALFVGSRGLNPKKPKLGSVSEHLAKFSQIPVMIVHFRELE